MTPAIYLAKFETELDAAMARAFDRVMEHLVAIGASEDDVIWSIDYFHEYTAAERHEILGHTRALLQRLPPDFDLEYPQR